MLFSGFSYIFTFFSSKYSYVDMYSVDLYNFSNYFSLIGLFIGISC